MTRIRTARLLPSRSPSIAAGLAWAALAWCAPAAAALHCVPDAGPSGRELCTAGVEPDAASALRQAQRASNWCWAATASMLLRHHGVQVSQEDVVHGWFGAIVNAGISGEDLRQLLARPWRDTAGRSVQLRITALAPRPRDLGLVDRELVESLAAGRPAVIGLRRHAMLLVEVQYERTGSASPAEEAFRLRRAAVIDPTAAAAVRPVTAAELPPQLLLLAEPVAGGEGPPAQPPRDPTAPVLCD